MAAAFPDELHYNHPDVVAARRVLDEYDALNKHNPKDDHLL